MNREVPIILSSSRLKWIPYLILSGVFTAGGLMLAMEGDVIALGCSVVFAIFTLIGLLGLFGMSSRVFIDEDGFLIQSPLMKHRFLWSDIEGFGIRETHSYGQTMRFVCFMLVPEPEIRFRGRGLMKRVAGWDASLPELYGRSAEELLELMERQHAIYLRTREKDSKKN